MLDSLCIIFYTAYFKWADGSYNPIPQTTNRIEIKTEKLKTLLLKTKNFMENCLSIETTFVS